MPAAQREALAPAPLPGEAQGTCGDTRRPLLALGEAWRWACASPSHARLLVLGPLYSHLSLGHTSKNVDFSVLLRIIEELAPATVMEHSDQSLRQKLSLIEVF